MKFEIVLWGPGGYVWFEAEELPRLMDLVSYFFDNNGLEIPDIDSVQLLLDGKELAMVRRAPDLEVRTSKEYMDLWTQCV